MPRRRTLNVVSLARVTSRPHLNCYWATPHLLASEYPGHPAERVAQARLAAYAEAGITAFVDLTHAGELEPYAALLPEGAVYHRRPILDMGVPTPEDLTATLDLVDDLLAEGHRVCVHCWGGIGRTGTLVACHLVRHGYTAQGALDHIARHWKTMEKHRRHRRSPQTNEQFACVRAFADRQTS